MTKKKLTTQRMVNELEGASSFFPSGHAPSTEEPPEPVRQLASEVTPNPTPESAPARERSRDRLRDNPRESLPPLPSRDEIQEFSFRLRDALKVKVQAEVPHEWQEELEALAGQLKVKKLELYRFILGEFLGKVKRRESQ